MTDLVWGFAPWIVFMVSDRFTSLYGAVIAGVVAGAIVLIRAIAAHRVHMLDMVSVVYFAGLTAVVWAVHPHNIDTWGRFAQAGSHGLLTALVFGSVLIGHPFTEFYARERVPQGMWDSAPFRAANRRLSAVWGLAFLVGTISLVVAGAWTAETSCCASSSPSVPSWQPTNTHRPNSRARPLPGSRPESDTSYYAPDRE